MFGVSERVYGNLEKPTRGSGLQSPIGWRGPGWEALEAVPGYSYRCSPGRAPPNSAWSPEGSPLSPKSKALKFKMQEEKRRQDRKSRTAITT